MDRHSSRGLAALLYTLLAVIPACGIPLATLQGPQPLAAGSSTISAGWGPILLDGEMDQELLLFNLMFGAYVSGRQGLTERLDVGGSAGVFNGITADAKYNLIPGPVLVSASLAASTGLVLDLWGDDDATDVFGIHPALLIGTERIYGGAKLMMFPSNPSLKPWQVLFAGASLGPPSRRFVAELGRLRDPADGEIAWFGGIALQRPAKARLLW